MAGCSGRRQHDVEEQRGAEPWRSDVTRDTPPLHVLPQRCPSTPLLLKPVDRIEGDAALAANLEVEVGSLVTRLTAHVADDLALEHALSRGHGRIAQGTVEG